MVLHMAGIIIMYAFISNPYQAVLLVVFSMIDNLDGDFSMLGENLDLLLDALSLNSSEIN